MNPFYRYFGLRSIQGRLTAIAFFFIIATAVTMGVIGYRFTVNYEIDRFHEHFSILVNYLASNAELGVVLGNRQILETLTASVFNVADIQTVEVFDQDGQSLIHHARPQPATGVFFVSAPVVAQMLTAENSLFLENQASSEVLGEVRLAYALTSLEQLKQDLAARYLIISLLLGTAPIIMYWTLARSISAPLQDLVKVAGRVSQGDINVRAGEGTLIETATLAGAINNMLVALQQQRQQIKETNALIARQQVLAEVGKFSMIVAHEIKNPLTVIKGSLSLLRKPEPLEQQIKAQLIGYIDEEIIRINNLVEDFLLFARPRTPAFSELLVVDLIANLTERLRLFSERVGVTVDVGAMLLETPVRCDIALLERALFNVVRNALEMSRGKVPIMIHGRDNRLTFSVKDDGPGFAEDDLEQIFEPFFSTRAKGTGLGLAIAREVMTAHQGEIRARNRSRGGAMVELMLPVGEIA